MAKKDLWSKLKYDSIQAPVYPDWTVVQPDGSFVLPNPETQPHPVHRNNEYSAVLAKVHRTELKNAPAGIVLFELREIKNSGIQYVIGINEYSRPVPTPQNIIEGIQAAGSNEAKQKAKQQLTFLLSQPNNVLTAYAAYMTALKSGEVPMLKDYFERIMGKADSADQEDGVENILQNMSAEDIAKLAK